MKKTSCKRWSWGLQALSYSFNLKSKWYHDDSARRRPKSVEGCRAKRFRNRPSARQMMKRAVQFRISITYKIAHEIANCSALWRSVTWRNAGRRVPRMRELHSCAERATPQPWPWAWPWRGKSLKGALVYGRPVDYAPTSTRVFVALDGDCYASEPGETGRTLRQTDAGDCCFACWGIRVSRAVLQEYRPILVYAVGGRIKQTALLPSLLSHKVSNADSESGWKVRLPIRNGFLNR